MSNSKKNKRLAYFGKLHRTGFTIIELLIVILVVSIGLIGVMNLITRIFFYTRLNQSNLIASFLAQEGIEIVRNIRDTNWVEGAPWDADLSSGDYGLDYQTTRLPDPNPDCDLNSPLKFDGSFYNCSSGDTAQFKRKVTITKSIDEILIKVSVTWDDHEVRAIEKIYNWYQP